MKKNLLLVALQGICMATCFSQTPAVVLDTLQLYPKAILVFDSALWVRGYSYNDFSGYGTIEATHNVKSTAPGDMEGYTANLTFMADTVADIKNLLQEKRMMKESYINTFTIDSIAIGNIFFYAFRFVPDECNTTASASPTITVEGLADLGEDFILELSYNFKEKIYTKDRWYLANQIAAHLSTMAVAQADSIMHYPYTEAYLNETITSKEKSTYEWAHKYFLNKRKCFDDRYLISALTSEHGKKTVNDLVESGDDARLAELYAGLMVNKFKEDEVWKLKQKFETQYSHTEVYALRRRLREEKLPLEDFFDWHSKGERESILNRLDELDELTMPENIDDYTNVAETRYIEALTRDLFQNNLTFHFADYIENEEGFILEITGVSNITVKEQHLMVNVQPKDDGTFSTIIINLPEDANTPEPEWRFVYDMQEDYILLMEDYTDTYFIYNRDAVNPQWYKIPKIHFQNTVACLGVVVTFDEIHIMEKDEAYLNYAKWKGDKKTKLDTLLIKNSFHNLLVEDEYPVIAYFEDDLLLEEYNAELMAHPWWNEETDLPLVLNDTAYISCDEYLEVMGYYLKPEDQIYFSELQFVDFTGDSIPELFQFGVSNGKLVNYRCFSFSDGKLTELKSSAIKKKIDKYSDCVNLKYRSMIGNYFSDEEFFENYYGRDGYYRYEYDY
ncbi:MAG: hypothetical protein ACKVOR_00600 [Flavobacteriales bacterium]